MSNKGFYKSVVTDEGRECTMCSMFKIWEHFTKCRSGTKGHHSYCRECRSKRRKQPPRPKPAPVTKQPKEPKWRITDEGRECSRCGVFKLWSEFSKNKHGTRGHQSWCGDCFREHAGRKRAREFKVTEQGRECSRCGTFKSWGEFYKRKELSTGHESSCKVCRRKRRAQDMASGKEHNWHLLRAYGIFRDDYDELVRLQGGRCAICSGKRNGARFWSVDHDHETGKVRGLLCQRCNALLGMAKDDVSILQQAIDYLRTDGVCNIESSKSNQDKE